MTEQTLTFPELRKLLAERKYYAAQTELATIIANSPNADVWEFEQKIKREIARANQLFSSASEAKKADCCVEILTICSDYPPALDFLRATPPIQCDHIVLTPSTNAGAIIINWGRSREVGVRYRLVRKVGESAPISERDGITLIDDASTTSFVDGDVEFGLTYAYSVFAKRLDVYSPPASKVVRFVPKSFFDVIWSLKERRIVPWFVCIFVIFAIVLCVSATRYEITELIHKNDDLSKELAELKSQSDSAKKALFWKDFKFADFSKSFAELQKDAGSMKSDPSLEDARVRELKNTTDQTLNEVSSESADLADLPERFAELQQSADSMKSALSLKDARIQDLSNQNETYEKQIADASEKLVATEEELADTRREYGELKKSAEATVTKLTSSEKDLAAARSQNQRLNATIKSLRAEVKKLSEQATSAPEEPYRQGGELLELKIKGETTVFRYCPPGSFLMGSSSSEKDRHDDETEHIVTLTKGYWLLETPVTQALWRSVMGSNPSFFKGDSLPVENVSWNDCSKFVDKLNSDGFAPKGMAFAFPTEAEWEKACRAGSTTRYNFGDNITSSKANYGGLVEKTTPVKSYSPNGWGLYDMHGNVSEWCLDWKGDYPVGSDTMDPTGPNDGLRCVIRGGGWCYPPADCRSARRRCNSPEYRYFDVGFRLALKATE